MSPPARRYPVVVRLHTHWAQHHVGPVLVVGGEHFTGEENGECKQESRAKAVADSVNMNPGSYTHCVTSGQVIDSLNLSFFINKMGDIDSTYFVMLL